MKRTNQCPKCGGTDIFANLDPRDRGEMNAVQTLTVASYSDPDALFFKGAQTAELTAWVCATCGFTEFYVKAPANLKIQR